MKLFFAVFVCVTLLLVKNDEIEDMCNFLDTQNQPNIHRLLSKSILPDQVNKVKGDAGKIVVIGGSIEFTGAPYFAAMSAKKAGADEAYIVTTTESAANVIKTYSPDLVVYSYLNSKYASKLRSLLNATDVIVIGPGLAREPETLHLISDIIEDCRNLRKPLVIDANALYAIANNVSLIKDYPCPGVIMTPNSREAKWLMTAVPRNDSNWYRYWGECVGVLLKGETDRFYTNKTTYDWVATGGGSGRRVTGQGDILAGALGTFYNWALKAELCKNENHPHLAQSVASYAAAKLTKLTNYMANSIHGRSMLASDMINHIHSAFKTTFSLV